MNHFWCQLWLQNQTQTHLPSGKQVEIRSQRESKGSCIFCLIGKATTIMFSWPTWHCITFFKLIYGYVTLVKEIWTSVACQSYLDYFPYRDIPAAQILGWDPKLGEYFDGAEIRLVLAQFRSFPPLFKRHKRHHWISNTATFYLNRYLPLVPLSFQLSSLYSSPKPIRCLGTRGRLSHFSFGRESRHIPDIIPSFPVTAKHWVMTFYTGRSQCIHILPPQITSCLPCRSTPTCSKRSASPRQDHTAHFQTFFTPTLSRGTTALV